MRLPSSPNSLSPGRHTGAVPVHASMCDAVAHPAATTNRNRRAPKNGTLLMLGPCAPRTHSSPRLSVQTEGNVVPCVLRGLMAAGRAAERGFISGVWNSSPPSSCPSDAGVGNATPCVISSCCACIRCAIATWSANHGSCGSLAGVAAPDSGLPVPGGDHRGTMQQYMRMNESRAALRPQCAAKAKAPATTPTAPSAGRMRCASPPCASRLGTGTVPVRSGTAVA